MPAVLKVTRPQATLEGIKLVFRARAIIYLMCQPISGGQTMKRAPVDFESEKVFVSFNGRLQPFQSAIESNQQYPAEADMSDFQSEQSYSSSVQLGHVN